MIKKHFAALIAATAFAFPAFAHEHGDAAVARAFIKEVMSDQSGYVAAKGNAFFQDLAKGQHPRATVITCSDSRVHTNMLDRSPEGDLFMIRNIGNQMATAKGSVEYGVNHLGSSLVLIIGHAKCGAIKAASGDYSGLEPAIKKELDTIGKVTGDIAGVKTNVNNQVAAAIADFKEAVDEGHLLVIGAVYDFSDDMKLGAGKLNIINVNGQTDPAKIQDALTGKNLDNELDVVHHKHH